MFSLSTTADFLDLETSGIIWLNTQVCSRVLNRADACKSSLGDIPWTLHMKHFAWICWIPFEECFGIPDSILVGSLILLNKLWVAHTLLVGLKWSSLLPVNTCFLNVRAVQQRQYIIYILPSTAIHASALFDWEKIGNVKNYGTLGQHWRGKSRLVPLEWFPIRVSFLVSQMI